MLGFIQNVNPFELLLIAVVAVLIFGKRLPEVAGQVAGQVQKMRRAFSELKRESGLDAELREAKRIWREAADLEARGGVDVRPPKVGPPPPGLERRQGPGRTGPSGSAGATAPSDASEGAPGGAGRADGEGTGATADADPARPASGARPDGGPDGAPRA